ncbi:MAG: leucyl aminopeptidase [Planctomycetota bacterium]|jgi:leucyl aminopeptidase
MQFRSSGAPRPSHRTDAFVLFRPENAAAPRTVPDAALVRAAGAALKAKEFSGKRGEVLLLHGGTGGRRLLLAGLGPRKEVDGEAVRSAAATAARVLERRRLRRATFLVPAAEQARAVVEGAGLAAYRFEQCRSKPEKAKLTHATVAPEAGTARGLRAAVEEGAAIVGAVAFARDLGNLPGNVANPAYLARRARELAGGKLTVRVHNRAAIKRLRMGAFAAVAQASRNEPRLIELRYRGAGASRPTVALVGKGVTFDTGGISIKPSAKMEEMKFDMCGAAAVLGVMHLVKELAPRVNLHALVPATDNMPGGGAYRPGDIVKARNGKTIEIISTDAEGRLLLCDALAYAAEKKPACILDLATLTGACVVALGDVAAGLFSNDRKVRASLEEAAAAAGEQVWPLPLFPRYTEMMKSPYADLKNGGGRWGGACTAAAFLQEFVAGVPWAHLDIAGTAWTDKDRGYHRKGATGYGVRLLWEFLRGR